MSAKYPVGTLIRVQDFRSDSSSFIELIIEEHDANKRMYLGRVVRVVVGNRDISDSPRIGFRAAVKMEGRMTRDWIGRIRSV